MFAGIIRDLHDVEFETHVAFPYGVDASDVRALLGHSLHELRGVKKDKFEVFKGLNLNSWKICKLFTA